MTEYAREQVHPVPEERPGAVYGYGPYPLLALRSTVGGILMGLALVHGISGGTLLVASGVYPYFVQSVADLTTLKLDRRAMVVLATVFGLAVLSVLLLGGLASAVETQYRFATYALFVGLVLGGIPVVWGMLRPATPSAWATTAIGVGLAVAIAELQSGEPRALGTAPGAAMLVLGGLLAAAAVVLPGLSGAHLLRLLGVHRPVVDALEAVVGFLRGGDAPASLGAALGTLLPVVIGFALGVVVLSHAVARLLARFEKPTLGVLLGLLAGTVYTLWPFRRLVPYHAGELYRGHLLTAREAAQVPPSHWRVEGFEPTTLEAFSAAGLVLAGFLVTALVTKFGRGGESGLEAAAKPRMSLPERPSGRDPTA
jgi:putative membrane protein